MFFRLLLHLLLLLLLLLCFDLLLPLVSSSLALSQLLALEIGLASSGAVYLLMAETKLKLAHFLAQIIASLGTGTSFFGRAFAIPTLETR